MLDVESVHDSCTLDHHNHLGLLLVRNLQGLQLLLGLELHFDLLDDDLLCFLLGKGIRSWLLNSYPHAFIVLFHLLDNLRVLDCLFHRSLEVRLIQIDKFSSHLRHVELEFAELLGSLHDHLLIAFLIILLEVANALLHHLLFARHEGQVRVLANDAFEFEH